MTRRGTVAPSVAAAAEDYTRLLGPDRVLSSWVDRELHAYDASLDRGLPDLVVLPRSRADLGPVLRLAREHGLPVVMRGAGTGYSGGAVPVRGGVVVSTRDLDRILELDVENLTVRCEPGVVLHRLQQAVSEHGLRYLPDPSSHRVCTIGGNIAENAGGPHALGHGPTSNFVVAVRVLMADGQVVEFHEDDVLRGGLDMRALIVGSEGTLGVVLDTTLRLVEQPERQRVAIVTFADQDDAVRMVEQVFATGLSPTALDMLTGARMPRVASTLDPSILFIDVEGRAADVEAQTDRLRALAADLGGAADVVRVDEFLQVRAELVKDKVRRMVGLSGFPRYYLFDCVAPRARLRDLMKTLREAADAYGFPLLNTFHAGDGNVHPAPFYDPDVPGHQDRLREFSAHVLRSCAEMGGTLSGEHGIGLEKRDLMEFFYSAPALAAMHAVKTSLDPSFLLNPEKLLPAGSGTPASHRSGVPSGTPAQPLVLDLEDGTLSVSGRTPTFADCAALLDGTPFELAYQPIGLGPDDSVLAAIDQGLPGLREPRAPRARDLVLACALEQHGRRVEFGTTCAKDVSGYEMRKLVFGGRGRLGELASVVVRLTAGPTDTETLRVTCGSAEDASDLVESLRKSGLPLGLLAAIRTETEHLVLAEVRAFGASLGTDRRRFHDLVAGPRRLVDRVSDSAAWDMVPRGLVSYARVEEEVDPLGHEPACWLPWQRGVWRSSSALGAATLAARDHGLAEAVRATW